MKVFELFSSKDGIIRLVKLRTFKSILLRPVLRPYSLEITQDSEQSKEKLPPKTRSGRVVKHVKCLSVCFKYLNSLTSEILKTLFVYFHNIP